jgi:hypothetical protein
MDQGEEAFNAVIDTGATVSVLGKLFMNMITNEMLTFGEQFSGKAVKLFAKRHSMIIRIKEIKQTFQLLISLDHDYNLVLGIDCVCRNVVDFQIIKWILNINEEKWEREETI